MCRCIQGQEGFWFSFGPYFITPFCRWCDPAGVTHWGSSALGHSWVWSVWNEYRHLQIWDHGSQSEKGWVISVDQEWDTPSSKKSFSIPGSFLWARDEWSRSRDRSMDSIGQTLCLLTVVSNDQKNEIMNSNNCNEFPVWQMLDSPSEVEWEVQSLESDFEKDLNIKRSH